MEKALAFLAKRVANYNTH